MTPMPTRIYFDWNATAPLRPEARKAMALAWELGGNPSSVHAEGRRARGLVEQARTAVGAAIGVSPRNIIFGSGGTEANMLALTPGLRRERETPVVRLLVSAIEHASVLAGGRFPTGAVETLGVTRTGLLDLDHLHAKLAQGPPALVSVMLANNETGVMQPVAEAGEIVHAAGGLLHVDAVQAFGKISFDINIINADLISISAHKIGGPKGIGALALAGGVVAPEPLLRGGGQESGRRAGTENVAGIAGFGAAIEAAMAALETETAHLRRLQGRLEAGLRRTPELMVFADGVKRLPNTTLFTVPGLKAETAVIGFDLSGIAVSSGSACSSGKVRPSHVLEAMGFGAALAEGAVRLSLGWSTSDSDVDRCLEAWRSLAGTLLRRSDETRLERF